MLNELLGIEPLEIKKFLLKHKLEEYRLKQIFEWLYQKNICSIHEMTNIPQKIRTELSSEYNITNTKVENIFKSKDGTYKLLIRLGDGDFIETVGMPYSNRFSCCISSQVGCPVGCIFCATGHSGFGRNLSVSEILSQLYWMKNILRNVMTNAKTKDNNNLINNILFMGMGEPLINFNNVIRSIKVLINEIGISARHITLSTAGYIPGLRDLLNERLNITLAFSMHAGSENLRAKLVPGMRQFKLSEILNTLHKYYDVTGRRITIEYCLIKNLNDSVDEAYRVAKILKGLNCNINLILYNKVTGINLLPSNIQQVRDFVNVLKNEGFTVTLRISRGADIEAACGQLRRRRLSINSIEK